MCSYESAPDEAYLGRNLAVQVLAVMARHLGYNVGVKNWNVEWPILYVDPPTGQVSWYIPKEEITAYFRDYSGDWDGHSVNEKRNRLMRFLEAQE